MPTTSPPVDRDLAGEAAYRTAEILHRAGRHGDALDMYLTAAHLTTGAPAGPALLGALQTLVATGDRAAAEAIYRRLLESSHADPALLAEARKALRGDGTTAQDGGATAQDGGAALPRSVR